MKKLFAIIGALIVGGLTIVSSTSVVFAAVNHCAPMCGGLAGSN